MRIFESEKRNTPTSAKLFHHTVILKEFLILLMPFSPLITRTALPVNVIYGNQGDKEIRRSGGTHQIFCYVMFSLLVLMTAAISE